MTSHKVILVLHHYLVHRIHIIVSIDRQFLKKFSITKFCSDGLVATVFVLYKLIQFVLNRHDLLRRPKNTFLVSFTDEA